jgi:hypothetical protein
MGDEADYIIDQLLAWDMDEEYYHRGHEPRSVTCNRCGKRGLHWQQVGDKWKLFQHIGLRLREHECKPPKGVFEDET